MKQSAKEFNVRFTASSHADVAGASFLFDLLRLRLGSRGSGVQGFRFSGAQVFSSMLHGVSLLCPLYEFSKQLMETVPINCSQKGFGSTSMEW